MENYENLTHHQLMTELRRIEPVPNEKNWWKGPGYYGPVQIDGVVQMALVARYFTDAVTLEEQKRATRVMTVRYFASEPDEATEEERKIKKAMGDLESAIAEFNRWFSPSHGNRKNPYILTLSQINSAIEAEKQRRQSLG